MKVSKHQLRRIIKEEKARLEEGILDDIFGKKVKSLDDVTTVGDFKKLIKYAQSQKRAELGKEAASEWVKSSFWDELLGKIPGAATAKNAADALKAMYNLPDEARTGTALDHMDIDDDVAKIVDDPIENAFLDDLMDEIEGMSDDAPMSNLNVTQGLAKYLEKEFNARTVAGFQEGKQIRLTRGQLRTIVEQVIGYTAPSEKSSDDDSGYETVGTMGKDVSLDDDSPDAQQARGQNIKSLTAQRQAALDKDDIEGAEEAGEQLSQAYSLKELYAFTFKPSGK